MSVGSSEMEVLKTRSSSSSTSADSTFIDDSGDDIHSTVEEWSSSKQKLKLLLEKSLFLKSTTKDRGILDVRWAPKMDVIAVLSKDITNDDDSSVNRVQFTITINRFTDQREWTMLRQISLSSEHSNTQSLISMDFLPSSSHLCVYQPCSQTGSLFTVDTTLQTKCDVQFNIDDDDSCDDLKIDMKDDTCSSEWSPSIRTHHMCQFIDRSCALLSPVQSAPKMSLFGSSSKQRTGQLDIGDAKEDDNRHNQASQKKKKKKKADKYTEIQWMESNNDGSDHSLGTQWNVTGLIVQSSPTTLLFAACLDDVGEKPLTFARFDYSLAEDSDDQKVMIEDVFASKHPGTVMLLLRDLGTLSSKSTLRIEMLECPFLRLITKEEESFTLKGESSKQMLCQVLCALRGIDECVATISDCYSEMNKRWMKATRWISSTMQAMITTVGRSGHTEILSEMKDILEEQLLQSVMFGVLTDGLAEFTKRNVGFLGANRALTEFRNLSHEIADLHVTCLLPATEHLCARLRSLKKVTVSLLLPSQMLDEDYVRNLCDLSDSLRECIVESLAPLRILVYQLDQLLTFLVWISRLSDLDENEKRNEARKLDLECILDATLTIDWGTLKSRLNGPMLRESEWKHWVHLWKEKRMCKAGNRIFNRTKVMNVGQRTDLMALDYRFHQDRHLWLMAFSDGTLAVIQAVKPIASAKPSSVPVLDNVSDLRDWLQCAQQWREDHHSSFHLRMSVVDIPELAGVSGMGESVSVSWMDVSEYTFCVSVQSSILSFCVRTSIEVHSTNIQECIHRIRQENPSLKMISVLKCCEIKSGSVQCSQVSVNQNGPMLSVCFNNHRHSPSALPSSIAIFH